MDANVASSFSENDSFQFHTDDLFHNVDFLALTDKPLLPLLLLDVHP